MIDVSLSLLPAFAEFKDGYLADSLGPASRYASICWERVANRLQAEFAQNRPDDERAIDQVANQVPEAGILDTTKVAASVSSSAGMNRWLAGLQHLRQQQVRVVGQPYADHFVGAVGGPTGWVSRAARTHRTP
jgi:hypothetical protein